MRLTGFVTAGRGRSLAITAALSCLAAQLVAQTTSQAPGSPAGPMFDVVSIKRNLSGAPAVTMNQSPGGGYTLVNGTMGTLISAAYPGMPNPVGLPDWARSERYDVTAKASLDRVPTADDRRSMMRALLAARLKFAAHTETQEQPAFDLVLARGDGRLGSGLTKIDIDCGARAADRAAAAEAARASGKPLPTPPPYTPPVPGSTVPPCSMRSSGNIMEGDFTMAGLAGSLRTAAGRPVVDKTGLTGYYRVKLESAVIFVPPSPDTSPAGPDEPPSIFVALPEQLGLKLESSRTRVDVLVIDHIERPSGN